MSERILLASGKGGVGKSTLTACLGRELALRGRRVLLVDTDVGLGALDLLLGVTEQVLYNWQDVLEGRCKSTDALITVSGNSAKERGLLHLLPAPLVYSNLPVTPEQMHELLMQYDAQYDYILIDAPAGLGDGLLMSAKTAGRAIVVATGDEISVRGALAVAALLTKNGVAHTRLVVNRFRKTGRQGFALDYDSMIDKTGVRLLGIVPESYDAGFAYAPPAANSRSRTHAALRRIAARMDGEHVLLGKL